MEKENLAKLENIGKIFTSEKEILTVLKKISFHINKNEFISIIGPSGCGKTTLLRIIGGLIDSSEGEIRFEKGLKNDFFKKCGYVFQEPTLLPWRTVQDNIALPLEISRNISEDKWKEKIDRVLNQVGLTGFENYYPNQISGGMRQRVSIARALIQDHLILLMDEPFGALDEITRGEMNFELLKIQKDTGKTIVFITHSIPEAVLLSDRVVVLSKYPGMIKEIIDISFSAARSKQTLESEEFNAYVNKIRKSLFQTSIPGEIEKFNPDKFCNFNDYYQPQKIKPITLYFYCIAVFLIAIFIWDSIVSFWAIPKYLVPTPKEVFLTYYSTMLDGTLLHHTIITLIETLIGFVTGVVLGIIPGYFMGKSRTIEKIFTPYIVAAECAPKISLAPLVVIWLGFGMISKIFLAALIVFFPIFVNMITGLHSIDKNLLELMKSNDAGAYDIFKKIEMPSCLPILFAAFKTGITLAIIGAVVGEFVGANGGLGYLTIYAAGLMNTPLVFAAILQLTIMGIILYSFMSWLEKKIIPWYNNENNGF